MFQLALLIEIVVTILFWTVIIKSNPFELNLNWRRRVNLVMDHIVPLIALGGEYWMNCQPFIKRHFLILVLLTSVYTTVLMAYSINGYSPYPNMAMDSSLTHTFIPILIMALSLVGFYLLEFLTRKKLLYIGGV